MRLGTAHTGRPVGRHRPPSDRGLVRLLLALGLAVGLTALAQPSNGTLASWSDTAPVSGTTISTGVLAAPTTVAVTQTCVADPAPVRRSGAGGTSIATGASSGSLTINKPASAQTGDVLLAAVTAAGNHTTYTPTAPAGWSLVRRDGVNQMGQFVYTRVVTASEPSSYTWSGLTGDASGGIAAYSGVDTVTPVDTSSGDFDSNPGSTIAPLVTTTRANVVLVGIFGLISPNNQTPPGSMTSIWSGFSASGTSTMAAQESWPTPGNTGSRTSTAPGTQSIGQLVALQPPARPYATTTWTPSSSSYASGQTFTRTSNAVQQRQATLPAATTSQYEGPLVAGTPYTMSVVATYNNWVSSPGTASFTGRTC